MTDHMAQIQAGAGIAKTPTELRSYYQECLTSSKSILGSNPIELKRVTTYIQTCMARLDSSSDTSAFDDLRSHPVFALPDGMLAQGTLTGIALVG